jgi:hypothetical protein
MAQLDPTSATTESLAAAVADDTIRVAPRRIFTKMGGRGYWLRNGTNGDWRTDGVILALIEAAPTA